MPGRAAGRTRLGRSLLLDRSGRGAAGRWLMPGWSLLLDCGGRRSAGRSACRRLMPGRRLLLDRGGRRPGRSCCRRLLTQCRGRRTGRSRRLTNNWGRRRRLATYRGRRRRLANDRWRRGCDARSRRRRRRGTGGRWWRCWARRRRRRRRLSCRRGCGRCFFCWRDRRCLRQRADGCHRQYRRDACCDAKVSSAKSNSRHDTWSHYVRFSSRPPCSTRERNIWLLALWIMQCDYVGFRSVAFIGRSSGWLFRSELRRALTACSAFAQ